MERVRERGKLRKYMKKHWYGYVFILPIVIGVLGWNVYPMIASIYYSFFDFNLTSSRFIGLGNYEYMFGENWAQVFKSLMVTFRYGIISLPLNLVLSFSLALFLNQKLKGMGIIKLLYYLPCILPGVVSGLMWRSVFSSTEYGLANQFLSSLGLPRLSFFDSASQAMNTAIFMGLWGIGGGMLMWLAAIRNVPESLIESARIDGAGYFRCLFSITIPMCTPMIFYNLVTSMIGVFQTFGTYVIVDGGGVDDSLLFFAIKIYQDAFTNSRMGYACAEAWLMFAIILVFTLVLFKTNKWVVSSEG